MSTAWHQQHLKKRVLNEVFARVFEQTNIPAHRILSRHHGTGHVIAARDEVIRQLDAIGLYSMSEIGRALGRDHSSVRYALLKPRRLLRWRRPQISHLRCRIRTCWCHIELPPPPPPPPKPEPEPPVRRYLIPYAGAEYLTERSS